MGKTFTNLKRFGGNPIIGPNRANLWESGQTFNPGAILLENKVHLVYRAIGDDGVSRFGYAVSQRDYSIAERLDYPVYQCSISYPVFNRYSYASGGGFGGAEDPRIVRVDGEDVLYLTYTAYNADLRMALTSITIDDFINKNWNWTEPIFMSPPGQAHKNWVIFPEKINGKYAILHNLNPQIMISYHESLQLNKGEYFHSYITPRPVVHQNVWDAVVRGAGPPPVKTEKGWLLFYHAMTLNEYDKYKVGAMLLDLADPSRIIYRSAAPILEPSEVYENSGFKPGIIYLSGAIVDNGKLSLYYGASDSYVCVASCSLDELLEYLVTGN